MTPDQLEEIERRAEALGPALQEVRSLAEEEDFQGGMSQPKGHPTSVQRVQPLLDSAADIPALLAYVRELEAVLREQWDYNHAEHCGWPTKEGHDCRWPLPVVLGGDPTLYRTYDPEAGESK